MTILIWLFTFLLVLDCLILMLLVLIQLPKKEAGMGQAFGGGATDALFGAGSGTALTKMTKYTAVAFFVLTLLISMMFGHQNRSKLADSRSILTAEDKLSLVAPTTPGKATNAPTTPATTNASTNASPLLSKPETPAAPAEKPKP
jgi:preprotein translocase subunit SecG